MTIWSPGCSPPGSSVHGILQAILELLYPPPGDLSNPGIEPASLISPELAGRFFTSSATWEDLIIWQRPTQYCKAIILQFKKKQTKKGSTGGQKILEKPSVMG